jgi:hypothetical protein
VLCGQRAPFGGPPPAYEVRKGLWPIRTSWAAHKVLELNPPPSHVVYTLGQNSKLLAHSLRHIPPKGHQSKFPSGATWFFNLTVFGRVVMRRAMKLAASCTSFESSSQSFKALRPPNIVKVPSPLLHKKVDLHQETANGGKAPKSVHDIQVFIGFANFYRRPQ